MANSKSNARIHPVLLTLGWQSFALVLALGVAFLTSQPWLLVKSFCLGCAIFALPNTYFTLLAFKFDANKHAVLAANSIMKGERGKLILVATGFALVFKMTPQLQPLFLFTGFIYFVCLQWLVSLHIAQQSRLNIN